MKGVLRSRTTRYVVCLLVVASILLAVGVVFASSEGGHGDSAQRTKELIWRTMNFVVLAGVLVFLMKKPLAKGLAARRQGIKDQLDDLERQKAEAQQKLSEYQQKLNQLDKEVEKIVAEYVKDGEAAKAKIIEEAKSAAEKLQAQAKKNIENEFEKARQQLRAELVNEAVAIAETVIKDNINQDDQKHIIDEYLTKVVVAQ